MDSNLDPKLDIILERALATVPIIEILALPPHNWTWDGPSSGTFAGLIQGVEDQVDVLAEGELITADAARNWDLELDKLIADGRLGNRLSREKFLNMPLKLACFAPLRFTTNGRDMRYKQVLAFEKAWKLADSTWVFKPTVTLASYTTRRKAITDLQETHADKLAAERNERSLLHELGNDLEALCVRWYDAATATFPVDTQAGVLIRTIPTTYNPNRPPGPLRFTTKMATGPNTIHLAWRAARGEKYHILAKSPTGGEFVIIFNGVTDKQWIGLGMEAGLWSFKGYATNAHGEGAESDVVTVEVANAAAA